jgi:hypothetical protein
MIAMPPLIPTAQWNALSLAIASGDAAQVKRLVEEENLDVNAFLDASSWMPVLMDVLISNGWESEADRLELVRWLLEKGANPNICGRGGYNCLHVAVQQEKYLPALELMLDYRADVNVPDADGSNIVYWAIQAFLLRAGDEKDRTVALRVLGKILQAGADLDQPNRFDMTARGWLQHAAPEVQELVAQWEAGKPVVKKSFTKQPMIPLNLHYPELAGRIWKDLVPPTGRANTVQGELLRSVERLRDDAKQNGNMDRRNYKRMAVFVRDTLVKSDVFDKSDHERIKADMKRVMKVSKPYLQDDIYDQMVDRVCVFCTRNEEPIPLNGGK